MLLQNSVTLAFPAQKITDFKQISPIKYINLEPHETLNKYNLLNPLES